ncbi:MAG: exopolysaccharide biosynthesis protein [bacterium]|nr:exopolysaccharide biosynthesis protein [bacterium]
MAAEDGCTAMVATPHLRHENWWNGDRRRLEKLWEQVRDRAKDRLEIFLGGEIAVNSQSCQEMELLPDCGLLPLAGSRYLLLELDVRGLGPDPEDLIHELSVAGWVPVLAHPERIPWLAGDLSYLLHLVAQGALLQITAMSLTGDLGRFALEASQRMLDAKIVHFVASDAHDSTFRRPGLSKAYQRVVIDQGEELARAIFFTNPSNVLANQPLHPTGAEGRASDAVTAGRPLHG